MLILSRHAGESIIIGNDVVITVVSIVRDKVRLGVSAPVEVQVDRVEVRDAKVRDGVRGRAAR